MRYDYSGIRQARRAAGLTQEDLAERLGINRATISKYESGVIDLSLGQLSKIAGILNTTVYEMVNPDWAAIDSSDSFSPDEEIQAKFKKDNIPFDDSNLNKSRLDSAYKLLNSEGRRVAADAVEIIAEVPRYRATPRPDAPETPPEGE